MENTIQTNAPVVSQASQPKASSAPTQSVASTREVAADMEKAKSDASQAIASSADEVRQAAESLRVNVKRVEPALKITVDDAVDIPVVTVMDQSSNKVIRQIPNEEVVALARFMEGQNFDDYSSKSALRGVLLDDRS
jgi:flagellar protein FlaG